MPEPLIVAIVGAESSGKSTLAQALHERLSNEHGLDCALVTEWLRDWCYREGRTPRENEQLGIANEQARLIEAAARQHALVICDTTPLMIAVYSEFIFGDRSLLPAALAFQRRCSITLLTAPDLPWEADVLRDSPAVQAPIDALIRGHLLSANLPWASITGSGAARLESALDALTPLLAGPDRAVGLFSRLQQQQAAQKPWRWTCEQCDVPECEHRLAAERLR